MYSMVALAHSSQEAEGADVASSAAESTLNKPFGPRGAHAQSRRLEDALNNGRSRFSVRQLVDAKNTGTVTAVKGK